MNWQQLISNKRFGLEQIHEMRKDDRSEFQRDFDRLIFSAPFRRLQNKTQVFPLPGSIFVHNRLTHSLEVSCVGRSLGDSIANKLIAKHPELASSHVSEIGAIVSAACLAHDLGNPPFGHSGEKAIATYFSEGKGISLKEQLSSMEWEDLTHFEGNANAFRLLTHQFRGRRQGGFVMTYSTLASIVKYPFPSILAGKKLKFGFFTTEIEDYMGRYGLLQLRFENGQLILSSEDPVAFMEISQLKEITPFIEKKLSSTSAIVNAERRGHIKMALTLAGFPVEDLAGYTVGDPLPLKLRETTLSGKKTLNTIKRAIEKGYYIRLYYVGLDTMEESLLRIENRVKKGGHNIDTDAVTKRFGKRFEDLLVILPYCNEATFYDNDNGFVKVAEAMKAQGCV